MMSDMIKPRPPLPHPITHFLLHSGYRVPFFPWTLTWEKRIVILQICTREESPHVSGSHCKFPAKISHFDREMYPPIKNGNECEAWVTVHWTQRVSNWKVTRGVRLVNNLNTCARFKPLQKHRQKRGVSRLSHMGEEEGGVGREQEVTIPSELKYTNRIICPICFRINSSPQLALIILLKIQGKKDAIHTQGIIQGLLVTDCGEMGGCGIRDESPETLSFQNSVCTWILLVAMELWEDMTRPGSVGQWYQGSLASSNVKLDMTWVTY